MITDEQLTGLEKQLSEIQTLLKRRERERLIASCVALAGALLALGAAIYKYYN